MDNVKASASKIGSDLGQMIGIIMSKLDRMTTKYNQLSFKRFVCILRYCTDIVWKNDRQLRGMEPMYMLHICKHIEW